MATAAKEEPLSACCLRRFISDFNNISQDLHSVYFRQNSWQHFNVKMYKNALSLMRHRNVDFCSRFHSFKGIEIWSTGF